MVNMQKIVPYAIVLLLWYVLHLFLDFSMAKLSVPHPMLNNVSYYLILNLKVCGSLAANRSPKAQ